MSLIKPRFYNRDNAHFNTAGDAADGTEKIAQDSAIVALFQPLADAQAELRDGNKKSNAKNVLAAAIAAAEKEFKGNPFSSRDKRIIDDAKKVLAQFDSADSSFAADAKFKIGDKVKYTGSSALIYGKTGSVGTIKFVDTKLFADGYPMYGVEFPETRGGLMDIIGEKHLRLANSRAADACGKGEDAEKFRVGQKVKHTRFGTIGKVFEIAPDGGIGVQWSNGQAYYGEFHRPLSEIVAVDACEDSSELNNDADLRASLSKMADIAKRLTDAKVSFKAGWTPDGIGEIILDFPNIESARKYNYYKLFNAWDAARSQIVPRWAVNIGGYRVPRIEGNRMTISILHFST